MLYAETKPKFLCLPYTKQRKKKNTEKEILSKSEWRIEQKTEKKTF